MTVDRKQGEITVGRAAQVLGVHRRTVYYWTEKARHGEPSPLSYVRQTVAGQIRVSASEVSSLRDRGFTVGTLSSDAF